MLPSSSLLRFLSFFRRFSHRQSFRRQISPEKVFCQESKRLAFHLRTGLHRIRIFLGAPLSTSSAVFFTNFKRCASSLPLLTIVDSQICEFLPLAGVSSVCSYGYGLLKSDPPPYSPLETSVLSSQLHFSHRESLSGRRPPPHRCSSYPPNWRMVSALLPSLDSTRLAAGCRALSAAYLLHRRCHSTVVTLAELGQNNLLVGLISPSPFNSSPVSQPNNQ